MQFGLGRKQKEISRFTKFHLSTATSVENDDSVSYIIELLTAFGYTLR